MQRNAMKYKSLSRAFGARGYFVASSGNVTDEVIIKYIEEQGKEPPGGDFRGDD